MRLPRTLKEFKTSTHLKLKGDIISNSISLRYILHARGTNYQSFNESRETKLMKYGARTDFK